MTLTAANASRILRTAVVDYNYWGESEADSPLRIGRSKDMFGNSERILRLDSLARRKASGVDKYVAPERRLRRATLDEVFQPLMNNALDEVKAFNPESVEEFPNVKTNVEALEYYVQLYSVFKELDDSMVCYIEDIENDPWTGLLIVGKGSEGESVFAYGLLVQT